MTSTSQPEAARRFSALHVKGRPFVLFNIWDAGSARAVREAGAAAIATGSWSVAAAFGFEDGEQIPLDLVIENLRRIVATVDVPVSLDFESGYSRDPAVVIENVTRVIENGAVGINFEDQQIGTSELYSMSEQANRIKAVRAAADRTGIPLFINARIDLFLKNPPNVHAGLLPEALQRAAAYADAGASGIFFPGLVDAPLIGAVCAGTRLPVNIITKPGAPSNRELAQLGVARISHGPLPYRQMIAALKEAAAKAMAE